MNCLSLPVVACPTATTLYSYTFIGVKVYLAVNTELMDNSKKMDYIALLIYIQNAE
jgi:hypothetical protein